MERENFKSRLGFILIAAGCAIGLGNVWRFPYIAGQYGGAAFVLPYLGFLLFLGLPIVTFDVVYNRATTEGKALYFTDAASLREVVRNRTMDFPALAQQMKEIADRRYRWQLIAEKYAQLY